MRANVSDKDFVGAVLDRVLVLVHISEEQVQLIREIPEVDQLSSALERASEILEALQERYS